MLFNSNMITQEVGPSQAIVCNKFQRFFFPSCGKIIIIIKQPLYLHKKNGLNILKEKTRSKMIASIVCQDPDLITCDGSLGRPLRYSPLPSNLGSSLSIKVTIYRWSQTKYLLSSNRKNFIQYFVSNMQKTGGVSKSQLLQLKFAYHFYITLTVIVQYHQHLNKDTVL